MLWLNKKQMLSDFKNWFRFFVNRRKFSVSDWVYFKQSLCSAILYLFVQVAAMIISNWHWLTCSLRVVNMLCQVVCWWCNCTNYYKSKDKIRKKRVNRTGWHLVLWNANAIPLCSRRITQLPLKFDATPFYIFEIE